MIERAGRRFRVSGTLVVDTLAPAPGVARPGVHWAEVALERLRRGEPDWFSYNVISVSRRDAERIEQVSRAAYREIRGIVKASEPCEQAALLTLQLVRWSDGGPPRRVRRARWARPRPGPCSAPPRRPLGVRGTMGRRPSNGIRRHSDRLRQSRCNIPKRPRPRPSRRRHE